MLKKILSRKLFPSGALYYRHKLLTGLGQIPIVVYSMGKVGSSTVYYTLKKNKISQLVYHIHFLSDFYLEQKSDKYKQSGIDIHGKLSIYQLLKGSINHVTTSYTLKRVSESGTGKRWKIITLVRDPVATFFSHIFQHPKTNRPFLLGKNGELDKNKVESYISDYFVNFDPDKDYISNWFDREFYIFTNTDIYSHHFDPSKGYNIIREENFDIAVIVLKDLDKCLNKVIAELIHSGNKMNDLNIIKKNIRENEDDTGLYKYLKNSIVIPKEGLERVYATKYARHFFTPEYRDKMIEKWSVPRATQ